MTKDWVQGVGHSPVCQILLQIVVRAVITSSPTAWTSSAGMLSTPADFPFFSDCTATSTSSRSMGWSSSVSVWGQFSTDGSPWPCDCTAQCSILSISSVSLVLLWGISWMILLPQWHSVKNAGGRLHWNMHTPLTQWSWSGLTMSLPRHSMETYLETSSHTTCKGTLGHIHLSLLNHCGLIMA